MTDWLQIVPWALSVVLAAILGAGFVRKRRKPDEPAKPKPVEKPPAPEKTADEHENEQANETADAVDSAARDADVDANDVADLVDLADDVRGT